ncbi:7-alpha-hydroxysteroid dehydrogenase [Mycobacterium lepraemurium]|nr:7-alpha-hydroxysteroid dehydrogenase [Mycobacterium lepraemurium]
MILDRFRLDDKVAVITGSGPRPRGGHRGCLRRGRRGRSDRLAHRIATRSRRRAGPRRRSSGACGGRRPGASRVHRGAGRPGRRGLRGTRHRRQQRRRHHAQHAADHLDEGSQGRLHLQRRHRPRAHRGGRAADAGALRRREHHQHHLDHGPAGRAGFRGLRHGQGRAVALHPADRPGSVPADSGQRDRAVLDPHLRARRGGLQRRAAGADGEGHPAAPSR